MNRDWLDTDAMYVPVEPLDLMAGSLVHDDRDEQIQAEHRFTEGQDYRRWMQHMHRLAERGELHTADPVEVASYENNRRVQAERWAS